jgi:hypothetical protein
MKLYKYLPPDRVDVVANGKLRFTQPQDFNDPFEVLPNIDALLPPDKFRSYFSQFENDAKHDFDKALREKLANAGLPPELATLLPYDALKAVGLDFTSMAESILPVMLVAERERFSTHIQQTTGEKLGILSLSENPTSLLMWAHYAASHHGFVLEFDSAHPFFNQQKNPREALRHLLPVTYSTERPSITLYDPDADEETWGQRLIAEAFLTKSTDWSYEREWRMFLPLADSELAHDVLGRVHLFEFPTEALVAVIFGARCLERTRRAINRSLARTPELSHVERKDARISTTRFEVLIGDASRSSA